MRTLYTTTNSTQTVFSWLVAQEARLHRQLQQMRARRALGAAFARVARDYPRLVASLFDAHFVQTRVAPMVVRAIETGMPVRPEAIAAAWLADCLGARVPARAYDLSAITACAAELLARLDEALSPAGALEAAEDCTALFAEAVQADSNLELDWLWLAERVRDAEQRRYCYAKVLHINPGSELARRALAGMEAQQAPARELAMGWEPATGG